MHRATNIHHLDDTKGEKEQAMEIMLKSSTPSLTLNSSLTTCY